MKKRINFQNIEIWDANEFEVWQEIVSRFGQADYDNVTKRAEHETTLKTEWDAQTYARNRRNDYPDMGEQFNKIYDDGLTKWKSEMVDPVKTKWPKDNSGPVE